MSINSINSHSALSAASNRFKVAQNTHANDADSLSGVSVQVSQMGQLMNELTSLSHSDPAKFKQVVLQIAQQFSDAASSQDGQSSDLFSKLADRFNLAGKTGDASALAPQTNPGPQASAHHRRQAYADANSAVVGAQNQTDDRAATMNTVQGIISQALQSAATTT
jgi:hypothetical protein